LLDAVSEERQLIDIVADEDVGAVVSA
jgi:hypothetical protein